jgi:hypothetical protein
MEQFKNELKTKNINNIEYFKENENTFKIKEENSPFHSIVTKTSQGEYQISTYLFVGKKKFKTIEETVNYFENQIKKIDHEHVNSKHEIN